jgi:hypothetical protein
MKIYRAIDYQVFNDISQSEIPDSFILLDHIHGFDVNKENSILNFLDRRSAEKQKKYDIKTQYIFNDDVLKNYKNLNIQFSLDAQHSINFSHYDIIDKLTKNKNIKNFVCSFNGADHLSRQFLTSALYKFGWFKHEFCTKNFIASRDRIDGNLDWYTNENTNSFFRKFIISDTQESEMFYNNTHGFSYSPYEHLHNIQVLETPISLSFVQIVSETLGTSYYPFITEKFLYSIVTKGLFVTYGQPGWHDHLEKYYGFKKYDKIFNYEFDQIDNPVVRLVKILEMLSKFERLSEEDWHDLYRMEYETIEYNYDHYFSRGYLHHLKNIDLLNLGDE